MSRFDPGPVLQPLKDFQRATVEHVADRLYRSQQPSRRFLVADETGLGKSLVARGVIARAIEQLQDDDSVERIDIVYVCSNTDIADQNLKRLNVTGQEHLPFASRLTLLAKHSHRLAAGAGASANGKTVNLVSFTPGTSFEMGWRTGKAEERALLHLLLTAELGLRGRAEKSSRMLLQGNVRELRPVRGGMPPRRIPRQIYRAHRRARAQAERPRPAQGTRPRAHRRPARPACPGQRRDAGTGSGHPG
jgi:hypothetical protein